MQAASTLADLGWVMPIVAIVGVVGQWGIGAFYAGRMDERVRGQGSDIRDLKMLAEKHGERIGDLDSRVSHFEGRKGVPLGGDR